MTELTFDCAEYPEMCGGRVYTEEGRLRMVSMGPSGWTDYELSAKDETALRSLLNEREKQRYFEKREASE